MAPMIDPRGGFDIHQRKQDGTQVGVQIIPVATTLNSDGTGSFDGGAKWEGRQGDLDGIINGEAIEFSIKWPGGLIGDYTGSWYRDGHLRGRSVNRSTGETAQWWSVRNNIALVWVDENGGVHPA